MRISSGTIRPPKPAQAALLVHGGAWAIPDDEVEAHKEGLRQAIAVGQEMLLDGQAAHDVASETVAVLEKHTAFDAGRGAVLTRDGEVELDAGLMRGDSLAFGAIACVKHLPHPIRVANRLMSRGGDVRFLVGEGAEQFAREQGFPMVKNEDLIVDRERRRWEMIRAQGDSYHQNQSFRGTAEDHPVSKGDVPPAPKGTVGCVVRDRNGLLAAATSTGGTPFTMPGRVGDSPLPGGGYYATEHAAVSATGWGEAIASMLLCARTEDYVGADLAPETAASGALRTMFERVRDADGEGATGGLIVLDRTGRGGWAFTTPRMARGAWAEGTDVWVDV